MVMFNPEYDKSCLKYYNLNTMHTIANFCKAAQLGNLDEIKKYISGIKGKLVCDVGLVNIPDQIKGLTPLHYAAKSGQVEAAKLLIEGGYGVNAGDPVLRTPLYFAVQEGKVDMAKFLIENGAHVNALSRNDGVPLHAAAKACNLELVTLLIENGAELNIKDSRGFTPRQLGEDKGCTEEILSLLNFQEYNDKLLIDAIKVNNVERAELLIEKGVKINHKFDDGYTPLHWAKSAEMVDLLVKSGADVNAQDNKGLTPLHLAATACNLELITSLVGNRADRNIKDSSGLIPRQLGEDKGCTREILGLLSFKEYNDKLLIDAIKENNVEEAKLLIEEGVNIDHEVDSFTPLHWAKSAEMVDLLVKSGADVNLKDKHEWTPLNWAMYYDKKDIIEILLNHDKINVNLKDKDGFTPLHWAISNDKKDIMETLLNHDKVNVNIKDNNGWIPLHWAKDVGTAALLIEKGADVNTKDNNGNTLLHWAAKNGHTAIVELLIGKGVDIIANNSNEIPSKLAANEDIREKLENYEKSKITDFEKDLRDTQDKLTQILSEKNELLEKTSQFQKELRDLKGEQPVLEKVLLDMQKEFSKCNLAKSLDKAVQGLEEIKGELSPSYYAYPSGSGRVSFEDTINTILNDTKLLDNASMKSKVFKTVEGMLEMLKTCGAQSEDKLYTIMDKMQYVKENMPKAGETDFTDLDDLINNLEFSLIH